MPTRRTLEQLREVIDTHNNKALEVLAAGLEPVQGRPLRCNRINLAIANAGEMALRKELRRTDGKNIAGFLRDAALNHPCKHGKAPVMLSSGPQFEATIEKVLAHLSGRTNAAREVAEIKLESGVSNEDGSREAVIRASALKKAYELGLTAEHAELVTILLEIARHHQDVHRARLERKRPRPRV